MSCPVKLKYWIFFIFPKVRRKKAHNSSSIWSYLFFPKTMVRTKKTLTFQNINAIVCS